MENETVARKPAGSRGELSVFMVNVGLRRPFFPMVTPPMGLLYLAAYLRTRFSLRIKLVNQRLDNLPAREVARQAAEFRPDIVCLSGLTNFAELLGEVSRLIREAAPHALMLIGGPHVSAVGTESLAVTAADAALPGEGETGTAMVVRAYLEQAGLNDIPGLMWRDRNGEIVVNPGSAPIIEDLDSLPMPAYDLIDLPAYWRHQSIAPVVRRKYVSLLSSRGCPFGCMWCHDIFGKKMRMHSAERVVDEIACFKAHYGTDDFEFLDDTFNFSPQRVIAIAELLRVRNLKVRLAFSTGLRGDLVTQEVVEALHAAGTYLCGLSLESGSPRLQDLMGKRLNIPRFLKAVEMVAAKRIYITGNCMMGFPTESEEELQQTIDVACASRFHTSSFYTVMPYPGTALYEYVKQRRPEKLAGITYENLDWAARTIRVNLTDLPDEVLFAYQRKAVRKFFMNPRRMRDLLLSHPQPFALPLYLPILLNRATKGWGTSE